MTNKRVAELYNSFVMWAYVIMKIETKVFLINSK